MSTDLQKVIHDHREELSEAQVRSFMLQLVRTLRVVHKAGVLHRDLKVRGGGIIMYFVCVVLGGYIV